MPTQPSETSETSSDAPFDADLGRTKLGPIAPEAYDGYVPVDPDALNQRYGGRAADIVAEIAAEIARRRQGSREERPPPRADAQDRAGFEPYEEQEHPRDPSGRWSEKAGGGVGFERPRRPRSAESHAASVEARAQASVREGAAAFRGDALPGNRDHPGLIASRNPDAKGVTLNQYRAPSIAAMRNPDEGSPKRRESIREKTWTHNVGLLRDPNTYPNLRPDEVEGRTDDEVVEAFKEHVKSNLRVIYDTYTQEQQDRSKLWYDGARLLVDAQAKKYGLSDVSLAGVYAGLSPKMDWFQNVAIAEQTIAIFQEKQDYAWDDAMNAAADAMVEKIPRFTEAMTRTRGKTLADAPDAEAKALWVRTHWEAFGRKTYDVINSDGSRGGVKMNSDGVTPSKLGWAMLPQGEAAVASLMANGNRDEVSVWMGDAHKVRSFYNNILDPHSANDDVTMDTHAFGAALLRPVSQAATQVLQGFGLSADKNDLPDDWNGAARSSAVTGVSGLYGIYADAYRELAREIGLQPRQLQSITWEAKRELFPESLSKADRAEFKSYWERYRDGKIDLETAQRGIIAAAAAIKQRQAQARLKRK